jgi:hypothetical protein
MEKTEKKKRKTVKRDRKSRTEAIIRKAKKKQHINNAALILARWLN